MLNLQNVQSIIICNNYTKLIFLFLHAWSLPFLRAIDLFFSVAVFFFFFPSNAWKCPFLPLRNIPSDNQVKGNSLLGVLHNSICRFLWLFLAFDFFFKDSDFLFFLSFFFWWSFSRQWYQTLYKHKQNMSSRILSWNLHTYCNVES